jgi:hypothetical protein
MEAAGVITANEIRTELAEKIKRRLSGMTPIGARCECDPKRTSKDQEHEPPCPGFYYQMAVRVVDSVAAELAEE